MKLRIFLLAGLISAGTMLTLWLLNLKEYYGNDYRPDTTALPDNSMRDIELITTSETGKPRYRLQADYMIHFPIDDSTELESPNLLYYRNDKPPVTIRSETGWISSRGEEIYLKGKVDISQPADSKNSAFTVQTTELRVYPDKNIARTEEFFTAHKARLYVEGVGMEAHLLTDTLLILSQAKGTQMP